jgi:hypothetical protein
MGCTNENLGHRSAACDVHHVLAGFGQLVDPNFFNVSHAL